jgi:phenylacetate-CoA ligase
VITATPRYFDRELETLDTESVGRLQDQLVVETLDALQHNVFFMSRYKKEGVRLDRVRGVAGLRGLPIIRKPDVLDDLAEHPPYGSRLGGSPSSIVNVVESSGTSAAGREVQALDAADLNAIVTAEKVGFVWAGATEGTVVALHFPVGMTAAGYWWTLALYELRCNTIRLGGQRTTSRIEYMRRYGVEQMVLGSHYLQRLMYLASENGYELRRDFPGLKSILLTGGGWNVEIAERWSAEWGATLYEQYGSSQRCIAWTCERGMVAEGRPGVIHGLPNQYVLEVIDPKTNEHVDDGNEGEIVLTVLGRRAMPLVRYGTGDRAIFRSGTSCPCGRCFDGIEAGSIGRIDDMLRIRDRNLWPSEVDRVVLSTPSVLDYNAVAWIDARAQVRLSMELALEPTVGGDAIDVITGEVSRCLREETGLRFELTARSLDSGEIDETAIVDRKPRRWSDLRSTPGTTPPWIDEA